LEATLQFGGEVRPRDIVESYQVSFAEKERGLLVLRSRHLRGQVMVCSAHVVLARAAVGRRADLEAERERREPLVNWRRLVVIRPIKLGYGKLQPGALLWHLALVSLGDVRKVRRNNHLIALAGPAEFLSELVCETDAQRNAVGICWLDGDYDQKGSVGAVASLRTFRYSFSVLRRTGLGRKSAPPRPRSTIPLAILEYNNNASKIVCRESSRSRRHSPCRFVDYNAGEN
jgi:hypothetical protein